MNEYLLMARVHCPYIFIGSLFLHKSLYSKALYPITGVIFIFYLIIYLKDLFSRTTDERSLSYTPPLSDLCELTITFPQKTKIKTSDYLVTEETTLPPLINSLLSLHIIHKEFLISISDLIHLMYINNFNNTIVTVHFGKSSF